MNAERNLGGDAVEALRKLEEELHNISRGLYRPQIEGDYPLLSRKEAATRIAIVAVRIEELLRSLTREEE